MATRAQIIVEGNEAVKIYRHWDGYPAGVMPVLEPLVRAFFRDRGYDPEYLTARILMAFAVEEHLADPISRDFLGYGLDTEWHGDIEYVYYVRGDGTIEVWKTDYLKWEDMGADAKLWQDAAVRVLTATWRDAPAYRKWCEFYDVPDLSEA